MQNSSFCEQYTCNNKIKSSANLILTCANKTPDHKGTLISNWTYGQEAFFNHEVIKSCPEPRPSLIFSFLLAAIFGWQLGLHTGFLRHSFSTTASLSSQTRPQRYSRQAGRYTAARSTCPLVSVRQTTRAGESRAATETGSVQQRDFADEVWK